MFRKIIVLSAWFLLNTSFVLAASNPVFTAIPKNAKPFVGVGVSVELNFTLSNSGTTTGYIPIIRMVIPEEVDYASIDGCSGLGSPDVIVNTTGVDSYTGETVTLATGERLVTIIPPIAQLSSTQPALDCNITFQQTADSVANTPFTIKEMVGIFVIGDNPSGDAVECGGTGDTVCTSASTVDINAAN